MPKNNRDRQVPLTMRWNVGLYTGALSRALDIKPFHETDAAICAALYMEHLGNGRAVSYSRRKQHYGRPLRYRDHLYTYRKVVGAVDRLDERGLIEHDRAPPGRLGWQSYVRPRPGLIDSMVGIIVNTPKLLPIREPLVVRDKTTDDPLLDYKDTKLTHEMRHRVRAQNEGLASIALDGPSGVHVTASGRLRRIFSGSFQRGGRFYAEGGAWQTLPKTERLSLTIDGEPVVEIDYSEMHPRIAYALIGIPYPGDAYALSGYPRDLVKIAMAVLFNSTSPNGARYTLMRAEALARWLALDLVELAHGRDDKGHIGWGPDGIWFSLIALKPRYADRASQAAKALLDQLIAKHAPIARLFFCSQGLALQRRDAEIADAVMSHLRRKGVVALPVHDSFLVKASDAGQLEAAMEVAARRFGLDLPFKRADALAGHESSQ